MLARAAGAAAALRARALVALRRFVDEICASSESRDRSRLNRSHAHACARVGQLMCQTRAIN